MATKATKAISTTGARGGAETADYDAIIVGGGHNANTQTDGARSRNYCRHERNCRDDNSRSRRHGRARDG